MARFKVKRKAPFLASVAIVPPAGEVEEGEVFVFAVEGRDQYGAAFPVSGGTWASSNPAVATVDASGTATGVAEGEVEITYHLNGTVHS